MNERDLRRIDLIVEHETLLARRSLERNLNAVFAKHSAQGRLHSGMTIVVSIKAIEEETINFLSALTIKLQSVAIGPESFNALEVAVRTFLLNCREPELRKVMHVVNGTAGNPFEGSAGARAIEEFDKIVADIDRKLAITAFDFEPVQAEPNPLQSSPTDNQTNRMQKSGKGGRPPADFWDDMWVEITILLVNGQLIPKSQADVERAMTGWIESQGHSAAVSTVRGRARRLWDRLSMTD